MAVIASFVKWSPSGHAIAAEEMDRALKSRSHND